MLLFDFSTHLLLLLIMPILDVRRYNGSYLSCSYIPRPVKFTVFIFEPVERIKSVSSTPGHCTILLSYFKLQQKDCLNKYLYIYIYIYIYIYCNYPFLVVGKYHPKFSKKQFPSVLHFMYVIHVQRNPRSYFIGKFQYIRSYQFNLDQNKMTEIMQEVCEVGPKSLQKNFRFGRTKWHKMSHYLLV